MPLHKQLLPLTVRPAAYPDTDLKSRKLMGDPYGREVSFQEVRVIALSPPIFFRLSKAVPL